MLRILLLILSVFSIGKITAQEVSVSAKAFPSEIFLGDSIQYQIRASVSSGYTIDFPSSAQLFIVTDTFEVWNESKVDTLVSGDRLILSKNYVISSFTPGKIKTPTSEIIYKNEDSTYIATVPRVDISVDAMLIEEGKIAPAKAIELTDYEPDYTWYIVGGLGGLILLGLAIWLILRLSKNKEAAPTAINDTPIVKRPPYEVAIEALEELKAKDLIEKDRVKEYQSALSTILRTYIQDQFGIEALELTTMETVKALKENATLARYADNLREVFFTADMVKFAKAKPSENTNELVFQKAKQFVMETKPSNQITADD